MAERIARLDSEDLSTLIYTSGTTGTPKAVMLTHKGWFAMLFGTGYHIPIIDTDVNLAFLPLSHVFERAWSYFIPLRQRSGVWIIATIPRPSINSCWNPDLTICAVCPACGRRSMPPHSARHQHGTTGTATRFPNGPWQSAAIRNFEKRRQAHPGRIAETVCHGR